MSKTLFILLFLLAQAFILAYRPLAGPPGLSGLASGIESDASGQAAYLPAQTGSPVPPGLLATSTPNPDGSIVHTVAPGETLWDIAVAYGITIAELRGLNALEAESTFIVTGQHLIIRLPDPDAPVQSGTPGGSPGPGETGPASDSQTPGATFTRSPTRTPPPPTATRRPTFTVAPSPSPAPTRAPLIPAGLLPDQRTLGFILIGIGLLGIVALGIYSLRK